jgi:hypothetical protein
VEQLACFLTEVAAATGPILPLLSTPNAYEWTEDHEHSFEAVKKALSSPLYWSIFIPAMRTYFKSMRPEQRVLDMPYRRNPKTIES